MGVLGNQAPRRDFVHDINPERELRELKAVADSSGLPVSEVIDYLAVLEQRRANDIALVAGDHHDEHVGGLAELLRDVIYALEDNPQLTHADLIEREAAWQEAKERMEEREVQ